MAFFDKTARTMSVLQKKNDAAAPEEKPALRKQMSRLKEKKAEWYVEGRDRHNKRRAEKCPPEYQTKNGARRYEIMFFDKIKERHPQNIKADKATIAEILDYHRDYLFKKGKAAEKSARTCTKRLKQGVGDYRLCDLDAEPEILEDFFEQRPTGVAPKYWWNHYATLRAAINLWCRRKKVRMFNPCDTVEIEKNINVSRDVPSERDFARLLDTISETGLSDWYRRLFIAVWETGLRINEVMKWRIEDINLDVERDENGSICSYPCFHTEISKQGRHTMITIPMSKPLYEVLKEQIGNRTEGLVWGKYTPPYRRLRETRLFERAGLSRFRPFHDFRKSRKYINRVKKKLPDVISREFQGHATDSMNDYYTVLHTKDLSCAVADSWE